MNNPPQRQHFLLSFLLSAAVVQTYDIDLTIRLSFNDSDLLAPNGANASGDPTIQISVDGINRELLPNGSVVAQSVGPNIAVPAPMTTLYNAQSNSSTLIVPTEGGFVTGSAGTYYSNVTVYKGIPFAAAPVGDLRWREPQSARRWTEVREANSFGAECLQSSMAMAGIAGPPGTSGNSTSASASVTGSEDCLFLNIWTAYAGANASQLRPVYVWIYGGGYGGGSGSDSNYDGEGLASKGLVVVTFNYRLGALGFLSTPQLSAESGRNASGNYGLMDQIFALKWVQRNIAAFGGDPSRVTIGGQSAGAGSCLMLALSPLAKGLFRAAIPESGGVMFPYDPEIASLPSSHYSLAVAEQVGAAYLANLTGSNSTTLAQLRNMSATTIVGSSGTGKDYADTETNWNGQAPLFHPVTDGYVLPRNYELTLLNGLQNDVAILTGNNRDEWGASGNITLADYQSTVRAKYGNISDEFLSIYAASNDSDASTVKNNAVRDNSRTSTFLWSQMWLKSVKSPLYYYFWTHAPPSGVGPSSGAGHGSEIQYFFGNLYTSNTTNWTATDYQVAQTMSAYVVNFVSNLNPNGADLPVWPTANGVDQVVMELGTNYSLVPITDSPLKVAFLQRFYATQRQW